VVKATDSSCLPCGLIILLSGFTLFAVRTAEATDWSPRSRPIQKVVFEKPLESRASTDGWKSKHEAAQQNRDHKALRARSRVQASAQNVVHDPFGDQQQTAKSKAESTNSLASSSPAGRILIKEKSAVQPIGQIRDTTFGFVEKEPLQTNSQVDQVQPRLKLILPEQPSHIEPIAITIIEETIETESADISSKKSFAVAKYEQSVLTAPEESEERSSQNDIEAQKPERLKAEEQKKEDENQKTTAPSAQKKAPQVLSKSEAVPEKVEESEIPLRTEPTPVTQSELSILTAPEQAENETSKSAPPDENEQRSVPLDLLRSVAPPFESLDLYSDDLIAEPESDALSMDLDATLAAGANAYEQDCRVSREYLLHRTLADISLNIAVTGVPGADFPISCDIETHQIPLNSYHLGQQEPLNFAWTASGLCHKPLYFRELQAERYGHSIGYVSQPFLSAAHFFCNAAILPYKMGMRPPQECVYALGHYWPGDPAPRYVPAVPISIRGGLMQAGAVLGAVYVLP
jgi:hypothetical protein